MDNFPVLLDRHAKYMQRFGLSEGVSFCSLERCKEALDESWLGKLRRTRLEQKLNACLDSEVSVCSRDRRELFGLGIWPIQIDGVTEIKGLPVAVAGKLNGRQHC